MATDVTDAKSTTTSLKSTTASGVTSLSTNDTNLLGVPRSAIDISKDDEHALHHDGIAYKRGGALPAKKKPRASAWLWTVGEEVYNEKNKKHYWLCTTCLDDNCFKIFVSTSTSWIRKHMRKAHLLTENGPIDSIELVDNVDDSKFKYVSIIDFEQLKQRLIEWIVVMHISFSQVENEWFRQFLEILSPRLSSWIPKSGNTVRNWIVTEFKRRQKDIKAQLKTSKSSIHLSFDMWTSPNHLSIVGIHGHFMSSQNKVDSLLLGLRRLRGPHSGENIAEAVVSVIRKYEITDRIGYFVLDNASSNTTCVSEILNALDISDTTGHRRLCCLGHVINLGAKAFLFGKNPDAFEREISTAREYDEEVKERESWRKKGPIGKLHNVVVYIRRTPQRREEFEEKVKDKLKELQDALAATIQPGEEPEDVRKEPLMVIQDNNTRWNSVFAMIQRALLLRDPLDLFIKRALEKPEKDKPLPQEDELSSHNWDILSRTAELLKPFNDQTIRLQSRAPHASHGSLWETVPTIEFLLSGLEEHAVRYGRDDKSKKKVTKRALKQTDIDDSDHEHLLACIKNAWDKLDDYYQRMDESPVYAASVVLNPRHKWHWFDVHWHNKPQWIKKAQENVKTLWNMQYKDIEAVQSELSILTSAPDEDPTDFDQFMLPPDYYQGIKVNQIDEYEQYLKDALQVKAAKKLSLCDFWASQENTYPSLARMAFDILSIPAMSSECERTFSSTKLLLTDRRARTKEDIIEASECLRAWFKARRFVQ